MYLIIFLCSWIKERYNNPKVIITENGWSDNGMTVNDDDRIHYIEVCIQKIACMYN